MSEAQELGELIGALIARSEQPNINLNVPDVHVRAELDASGVQEAMRVGLHTSTEQVRSTIDALKAAVVDIIGQRSEIDLSPVVEALIRSADGVIDYSRPLKSLTAAIEAQTAAQKELSATVASATDRIEAVLKAGKSIVYDDKGRVSAVKVN